MIDQRSECSFGIGNKTWKPAFPNHMYLFTICFVVSSRNVFVLPSSVPKLEGVRVRKSKKQGFDGTAVKALPPQAASLWAKPGATCSHCQGCASVTATPNRSEGQERRVVHRSFTVSDVTSWHGVSISTHLSAAKNSCSVSRARRHKSFHDKSAKREFLVGI